MNYIEYELMPKEVEESLLCAAWKKEGLYKRINIIILTVLAVVLLYSYITDPKNFYNFGLLVMILGLMFYILYGFDIKRKNKAEKITAAGGVYKIDIQKDGIVGNQTKQAFIKGKSEVFVSENVITFKIERNLFCIPRRALTPKQSEQIMNIVKEQCIVRTVKTERSSINA